MAAIVVSALGIALRDAKNRRMQKDIVASGVELEADIQTS
jgi:hypothetical protein